MKVIHRENPGTMPADTAFTVMQADTTPASFPLNGKDVLMPDGVTKLGESAKFATGSYIHVVSTGKNYVMNEAGTQWNEDGGSAS